MYTYTLHMQGSTTTVMLPRHERMCCACEEPLVDSARQIRVVRCSDTDIIDPCASARRSSVRALAMKI
jgi:hypothetical protein